MKKIIWIYLIFVSQLFFAQQNNQLWKGYFSYNEIVDVESATDKVFAATQNAVFSKALLSSDLTIYNSINGLKPESITTIHHSELTNKTFVGNTNGLLLIINSDGSITTKVDIINEVPVPPNKKKINDFYEHNGRLYISTDYGISVVDVATSEFIITYFIGTSGEETQVLQTTVLGNEIYAVTRDFGIRKGNLTNPNLYDFSQWQTFDGGYWSGIVTFNNELIGMNTNARTYRYNGTVFQEILNHIQAGLKIKTNGTELIVTTSNHVYVLNQTFTQLANITSIPNFNAVFTAATVVGTKLYIGTEKDGLFSTDITNPTVFENMSPNGPVRNYIFRVKKALNYLWAVYGDYTRQYNPYPLEEYGISKYSKDDGWELIPYNDIFQAKSICDLVINPNNQTQIYATSYFSGLLKIQGGTIELFNQANTGPNGLESLVLTPPNPTYIDVRVNSPAFDKDGNLWMTNAFVERAIKVLNANGQWQSYSLDGIAPTVATGRYGPMAIDKNKTKWIPSINDGLIAFNENYNNKFIVLNSTTGNLPDNDVRCVAVDNRNQLWIGTYSGLRVVSVDRFITETELTANSIIIQEGDLAQELFYQQTILDIAVDGANRKWVSIADGGVFLVSANGQQTNYQFTKNNSPLPSNNINDIEIDGVSGEVFFATDKGMVSFLGTSTKPSDDLANVYVYPNPVRPEFLGTVKISGLTDKANVKITDIEGNLVHETTTSGGTIEWDTTAFGKYKVASGVYMIFVASEDGMDSTVKKVMIIR
ncbi:type IX secretion system anionic LPS delivery protein PorZ [Flavobacterium celericrescens]|uniref:T9SS type A sorting domain-containing protein n=1 Tax=Flavobacterium celericrescens TaxID=2709780 RepID=A0ABX0ICX4_9FLAO|nr:two-component regulator propeller domain-containing protein [Flavobacterium celericrescens]NHM03537.1 T9SS type A sorting domain-containing protein [Flavobacterium celericrescens]